MKIIIKFNILAHKYHSRAEFLGDIELIFNNCDQYNGSESNFTKQAKIMVDFTKKALEEVDFCFSVDNFILVVSKYNIISVY